LQSSGNPPSTWQLQPWGGNILSSPVPKSASEYEAEGAGLFLLFIIFVAVIFGLVFDPSQVVAIGQSLAQAIGAPFVAFASGLINFLVGIVSYVVNLVTSTVSNGVSAAGNYLGSGWNYFTSGQWL
jgi:hypothetical protein